MHSSQLNIIKSATSPKVVRSSLKLFQDYASKGLVQEGERLLRWRQKASDYRKHGYHTAWGVSMSACRDCLSQIRYFRKLINIVNARLTLGC